MSIKPKIFSYYYLNCSLVSQQIGEAFIFDLVRLIGFSLHNVRDTWQAIDYVDCEDFIDTDPAALEQAMALREDIYNVCIVRKRELSIRYMG